MIKTLYFKDVNDLSENPQLIEINFSEHINVILGPKGGGKSTLFNLVAGLKNKFITSDTIEALASFNLEFKKAKLFNGEEIWINNIEKIKSNSSNKNKFFDERNDVVYQDDPIKKDINNASEIEDKKFKYAKQYLENNNPNINDLIDKIKDFKDRIEWATQTSSNSRTQEINWSQTFSFNNNDSKINIISQANYNMSEIKLIIDNEKRHLEECLRTYKEHISQLKDLSIDKRFNDLYYDEQFVNNITNQQQILIDEYVSMIGLFEKRIKTIKKIELIVKSFSKAYKKKVEEIKRNASQNENLKAFEKQTREYFKDFAKNMFNLRKAYSNILKSDEIIIKTDDKAKDNLFLSYKMKDEIILNHDGIIELIKIVLHTPRTTNDVSKWLLENLKENKTPKVFDIQKIKNALAREFKKHVLVLANGMVYDHMSLGQKSIYGIKYKFNKSVNDDIFLDQPEDNLDNNTIATTILDLIKQKKDNQVFIVTHNANIGILSNPEKIIIADNSLQQNTYHETSLSIFEKEDCIAAKYLEGGFKYLEERYLIVKGEKNGIKN